MGFNVECDNVVTVDDKKLTPWLIEPVDSMPHSQGLSNNPILSRINPIPRIDT
jgi:hypothetical protein